MALPTPLEQWTAFMANVDPVPPADTTIKLVSETLIKNSISTFASLEGWSEADVEAVMSTAGAQPADKAFAKRVLRTIKATAAARRRGA